MILADIHGIDRFYAIEWLNLPLVIKAIRAESRTVDNEDCTELIYNDNHSTQLHISEEAHNLLIDRLQELENEKQTKPPSESSETLRRINVGELKENE